MLERTRFAVVGWLVGGCVVLLSFAAPVDAQDHSQRWTVDPNVSLAWWQIDPHMGHLWATTCPGDPAWHAGESRSGSFGSAETRKEVALAAYHESRIPLYPRDEVAPVCEPAVSGTIAVQDTASWEGIRANIAVDPTHLVTGLTMRDRYMHKVIFGAGKYPAITFQVDSIVGVVTGDTLRGTAIGVFELRDVQEVVAVPVKAWQEPAGFRVQAQFGFSAKDLTAKYGISKFALGLGVGQKIWNTVHMGVDLILRPSQRAMEAGG